MREAILKRLQLCCFICGPAETVQKQKSGFQGLGMRGGVDYTGNRKVLGAMEFLYTLIVVVT